MSSAKQLRLAIILMVIGIFGVIGLSIFAFSSYNNNWNSGIGMSGMMNGGTVDTNYTVHAMVSSETQGTVDKATNTITFAQSTVNLVVLAAPPQRSGDYFEINNLINPTLKVKAGTTIKVTLVNEDNKMHGFEIVTAHPPFSAYPMMSYDYAFSSFIMPIHGTNSNQYRTSSETITASSTGTYYYLCPVPHHAAMGMYGKIVVG